MICAVFSIRGRQVLHHLGPVQRRSSFTRAICGSGMTSQSLLTSGGPRPLTIHSQPSSVLLKGPVQSGGVKVTPPFVRHALPLSLVP